MSGTYTPVHNRTHTPQDTHTHTHTTMSLSAASAITIPEGVGHCVWCVCVYVCVLTLQPTLSIVPAVLITVMNISVVQLLLVSRSAGSSRDRS